MRGFVNWNSPTENKTLGIKGTRKKRVKNTAAMEGAPKINAVLKLTSPKRYLGNTPTRLVAPTINKEYAVALTGSTLKR